MREREHKLVDGAGVLDTDALRGGAHGLEARERHVVAVEDALPRGELGTQPCDGSLGRCGLHRDALELRLALGRGCCLCGCGVAVLLLLLLVQAHHDLVRAPCRHRCPLVKELSLKTRNGHSA